MTTSIKIECPKCKRETKLIALKFLNDEEAKNDLKMFSSITDDMVTPEFSRGLYVLLKDKIKQDTINITISKIASHKIGLFKEECKTSNKVFKVANYYFMNHDKQVAGYTFRLGYEINYSVENLGFAEQLSKYCTTLNKESISIVLDSFGKYKKFTLTDDVAFNMNISPDLRQKFQVIAADSTMKPDELKEFIIKLRDRLEANNEVVKAVIKGDSLFTIQCLRNNNWYECVAIASKGYRIG